MTAPILTGNTHSQVRPQAGTGRLHHPELLMSGCCSIGAFTNLTPDRLKIDDEVHQVVSRQRELQKEYFAFLKMTNAATKTTLNNKCAKYFIAFLLPLTSRLHRLRT